MKKVSLPLLLLSLSFIMAGCAINNDAINITSDIREEEDKLMTITDFEHLSDEELEYAAKHFDKYPGNIGYINDKNYGRMVSSSSSAEDALAVVTNHFTDNRYSFSTCNVLEVRLDVETDLFYGVYVKWVHSNSGQLSYYDEYVMSFKKDIYDCKVKKIYTDIETSIIKTSDTAQIKQVMDFRYYNESYNICGSKLLSSEIVETENTYLYKSYVTELVGGDWGLQDEITLIRTIWEINKVNGEIALSSEDELKTIYVDGAFTHCIPLTENN